MFLLLGNACECDHRTLTLTHIPFTSVIHIQLAPCRCYIQNAILLTFMPPFILIYMYMFELTLISQLHPYENTEKRAKTLTGYLNNCWRKGGKGENK